MDATDLRPLAVGELLDRTFRLYRNHFWLFVGIMAIPSAFSVPFTVLIFSMQSSAIVGGPPSPKLVVGMVLFGLAFFCLFCAVYSFAIGATTYAVSEAYLGRKVTVRDAYGKVRGNFWRIIGVVVVALLRAYGMLILVGFGMAIVIGISAGILAAIGRGQPRPVVGIIIGLVMFVAYLAGIGLWVLWSLRYAVAIPALLLERVGVLAALRRSVQLTRGRRWQMLVAIFLCSMIAYVGAIVFQGPFFMTLMFSARSGHLPEWLAYAFAMSGAVGGAITGPVLLIALVLCYYDTRIRKEAFDLQFMMSSLDGPVPAPGTGSPA
jgi:MFS family permease